MSAPDQRRTDEARELVARVPDPELPMVTIADLGILRDVSVNAGGEVEVTITPTYSGCPALDTIGADVRASLAGHGYRHVTVRTVLAPPWSSDWITEEGRLKLAEAGVAPPGAAAPDDPVPVRLSVRCPRCDSPDTREVSRYGSTACKALHACNACREPFDRFKTI